MSKENLISFFENENQDLCKRLRMLEKKARDLDEEFLKLSHVPIHLPPVDFTFRAQQHQNNTLREFLCKIAAKIQADHDYLEFKKKKSLG